MAYLSLGTDKMYNLDAELGIQHRATHASGHWRVEFRPVERYPDNDSNIANRGLVKDWAVTSKSFGSVDTRDLLWVGMAGHRGVQGFPRATDLTELQNSGVKYKFFWEKFVSDVVTQMAGEGVVIDFSMHVPDPSKATTNRHRRYGHNNHAVYNYYPKVALAAFKVWVPWIRDTRPQTSGQASGQSARPTGQAAMDAMARVEPAQ